MKNFPSREKSIFGWIRKLLLKVKKVLSDFREHVCFKSWTILDLVVFVTFRRGESEFGSKLLAITITINFYYTSRGMRSIQTSFLLLYFHLQSASFPSSPRHFGIFFSVVCSWINENSYERWRFPGAEAAEGWLMKERKAVGALSSKQWEDSSNIIRVEDKEWCHLASVNAQWKKTKVKHIAVAEAIKSIIDSDATSRDGLND